MVAEIIFFTALALFIILLGRKFHIFEKLPGILSGTFSGLKNRTGGRISGLGDRVRKYSERRGETIERPQASEQGFWSDDQPEAKHELPNQFDEGEALLKAGKYQQAERFFLKAASSHPSDPKIYARLGLIYLQQKNHSDAIESLKVAAKLDKYNPSRHYNLALAYWGNKDIQRAIMSVREAISLDPVTAKYRQLLEQLLNGK